MSRTSHCRLTLTISGGSNGTARGTGTKSGKSIEEDSARSDVHISTRYIDRETAAVAMEDARYVGQERMGVSTGSGRYIPQENLGISVATDYLRKSDEKAGITLESGILTPIIKLDIGTVDYKKAA
jgi:hypothetical protein